MSTDPTLSANDHVWREVTDALLAGLTHDLNGRVAAIGGLLHVVALGDPAADVLRLLGQEAERLEAAVSLLRRYPRGAAQGAEAFDVQELVESTLALHERREDLEDLPVRLLPASGAPPARGERVDIVRSLLVLLARAGVPALGGARGGFELAVEGRGAETVVALRAPALPGDPGDRYLAAAAALARDAGGRLSLAPGAWELALPALV